MVDIKKQTSSSCANNDTQTWNSWSHSLYLESDLASKACSRLWTLWSSSQGTQPTRGSWAVRAQWPARCPWYVCESLSHRAEWEPGLLTPNPGLFLLYVLSLAHNTEHRWIHYLLWWWLFLRLPLTCLRKNTLQNRHSCFHNETGKEQSWTQSWTVLALVARLLPLWTLGATEQRGHQAREARL